MQASLLELHKRINARLFARQCWSNTLPVVKLFSVTIRNGYVDGFISANKGCTTASFHGYTK